MNCGLTTRRRTGTEQLGRGTERTGGAQAGGGTGSGLVSQLTGGMETVGDLASHVSGGSLRALIVLSGSLNANSEAKSSGYSTHKKTATI